VQGNEVVEQNSQISSQPLFSSHIVDYLPSSWNLASCTLENVGKKTGNVW